MLKTDEDSGMEMSSFLNLGWERGAERKDSKAEFVCTRITGEWT